MVASEKAADSIDIVSKYKSVFLLVSPSESFEKQLALCATYVDEQKAAMSWQNILRLLGADAMRGWREYMTFMEEEIRKEVCDRTDLVFAYPEYFILEPIFYCRKLLTNYI